MAITNYDMQMMAHKKREVGCLDRIATSLEVIAARNRHKEVRKAIEFVQNYIEEDEADVRNAFKYIITDLDQLSNLIDYHQNNCDWEPLLQHEE